MRFLKLTLSSALIYQLAQALCIFTVNVPATCALATEGNSLVNVTFFVPAPSVRFSSQLVLAYSLRQQIGQRCPTALGQTWWTLGGYGVSFITDLDKMSDLVKAVHTIGQKDEWDATTTITARRLASQELYRFQHDPQKWLLWLSRLTALGQSHQELDPEQPLRLRYEVLVKSLQTMKSQPTLLLVCGQDKTTISQFKVQKKPSIYLPLRQLKVKIHQTKRAHWLRWWLAEGDVAISMIACALLGSGAGSKWFNLLRVDQPLAYHAYCQWQLTPLGSELVLYTASYPERLKTLKERADALLNDLKKGNISDSEIFRAKKFSQWQYNQINCDPMKRGITLTSWLSVGYNLQDWQEIPERLNQISTDDIYTFLKRLTTEGIEVIADAKE